MSNKNWKLSYRIDSSSYAPLQNGKLTNLRLKNLTKFKMQVTEVVLRFDWMGTYSFIKRCNITIAPNKSSDLPDVSFEIELVASKGAHNYKPGISYVLLENDEWKDYTREYVQTGEYIEINPLPQKEYSVFVSHSNGSDDLKMISDYKAAMKSCGINGYFAEDDIQAGGILWSKITNKIASCDAFMILWTDDASKSGDVREEIGIAVGNKKANKFVPIVKNGLVPSGSLKSLGIEYIDYKPPNHQHALHGALKIIMTWATEKEKQAIILQSRQTPIKYNVKHVKKP